MSDRNFFKVYPTEFILQGKKVIPAENQEEMITKCTYTTIKQDYTKIKKYLISTVFHTHGSFTSYMIKNRIEPHHFETMVFDENHQELEMDRYHTYEEAEKGHEELLKKYSEFD
jgi:hypothetical protein